MSMELLAVLTVLCILLFMIGVSIVLVFGVWVLGYSVLFPRFGFANISIVVFQELNSLTFTMVPLFIAVGALINAFGLSADLTKFSRAVIGWLPGSTANTAIFTSGIFSAITGSNTATTASVGEALVDELNEEGYEPNFSAATIAAGGTVGVIVPPSIMAILYGIQFNVPVVDLFVAGIIPGLLMIAIMMSVCSYLSYKHDYGLQDYEFSAIGIGNAAWRSKHAFITVFLLLGGIFLGWFTPTESAAVAMAYVLLMGVLSGRFHNIDQVVESYFTAIYLVGAIFPIFVTTVMIQQGLSFLGLQRVLSDAVLSLQHPFFVGAAIAIILLITGSFMASVPNLILTAPLLAPAAFALGLSPIEWAIIFLMSDAIGFITPPYGLNLYVISTITDLDYMEVAYSVLPYLASLGLLWIVLFVFPEIISAPVDFYTS